ncbi:hypothetical protein B0O99DRAFT_599163 [Bisporella sp. PMI_857]|nr:hypothetical protein B0O99DRAFT_599163 [Bisporella sp. PMI_857]
MFDGQIPSSADGLANPYPKNVVKPVILMQASFIKGGLPVDPLEVLRCSSNAIKDISFTAIELRRSINKVYDHQMRSFFHLLKNEKDKTTFSYGAKFTPGADTMITGFVAQQHYHTSFGEVLGRPEIIRGPRLPDTFGIVYLMPATKGGVSV